MKYMEIQIMMKYFTHTNAGKLKLNFRTKMNLLTTG